jgi:hypothetical protein
MMIYLVYVSSAIRPFLSSELVDLLSKSHVYNTEVGITGMLLYKDGNFCDDRRRGGSGADTLR